MGKYSREFDGDGSKFNYGNNSVSTADKTVARWIAGCTLACWGGISFIDAVAENNFAKFGSIITAPLLAGLRYVSPGFNNEPLVALVAALLFAGVGALAFAKGIRWVAIALMLYFILCLVPWLIILGVRMNTGLYPGSGP